MWALCVVCVCALCVEVCVHVEAYEEECGHACVLEDM